MNKMKYNYRETEFFEWDDFFSCSDKELLKGVQTTYFQTSTISEMKSKIDYFINQKDRLLHSEKLNSKAIQSTYENEGYSLD